MQAHLARKFKGDKGFTLVELMVAMLVFGIGLTALAQAIPQGMQVRAKSQQLSTASSLAQQEVERLRSLPFNDADLAAGNHADPANPVSTNYTRSWTVLEDQPVPGMKQLTVTVSFPTSTSDSTATFTTFIQK